MKKAWNKLKAGLRYVFIDGLSGMALGLFATLIVGTIIQQIGSLVGGSVGSLIYLVGKAAASLTGAGIGVGVACKYKKAPLVTLSAAVCGMVGAYASKFLAGALLTETGAVLLAGPGEPLGAFIAAMVCIIIGGLISGKTKLDILLTPLVGIASGSVVGLLVGPPISSLMTQLGGLINWGTERQPLLMGIIVSVLMGIFLTLPISSAAIGVILNLSGIAAGAATVGCCCNMVGFAVISHRDNGIGGTLAQGVGTSMLQMPNIVRKPVIWLPAILSSAILGPVSTVLLKMTSNATGSGMGTAGLVGPLMTWQEMSKTGKWYIVLIEIIVMYFILPALLSLGFGEILRKMNLIKDGDMKLRVN